MSTEASTLEAYTTDWAKLLLTIPQATDVFHVGTSVWYGSDGQDVATPNFIVRTADPFWLSFDGSMPHGRAAHHLVTEVDREQARLFNHTWGGTQWFTEHTFGDAGAMDTWPLAERDVRIVEVPSGAHWAGPEYLRRIEGGTSLGSSIYQTSLRRLDPSTETLLPPEHYWASASPAQLV